MSSERFAKELKKIKKKKKSIAVPLRKSPVHPHLGNYVLLFSPLEWDTTELEEKENKDEQRYESTSSLQILQG